MSKPFMDVIQQLNLNIMIIKKFPALYYLLKDPKNQ